MGERARTIVQALTSDGGRISHDQGILLEILDVLENGFERLLAQDSEEDEEQGHTSLSDR
jgi:hypothetical protein